MIIFNQIYVCHYQVFISLFARTHLGLDVVDQLSSFLIAGDVKEHDDPAQDTIEDGEDSVHGGVLFVLSNGAADKASEGQGENDQEGSLTYCGCGLLGLVSSLQGRIVVSSPRSLD